jgi:Uma2 family endonuclease
MAVQFAQPYRFSEQQLARMAQAGIVPEYGTELIDGVPYWAGAPFRFSRDAYYRLGELGILSKRDRVERIHGEIIEMTPIGSHHSACVSRLNGFLTPRVGNAIVRYENPIALPQEIDPEPDLAVVRARDDHYENAHPTAQDALLVIEVSDSTRRFDLGEKARWYAEAGIPEYWMVDLTRSQVIVHQHPAAGEYQDVRKYGYDEAWTSASLGGLSVPVNAILKPR